MKTLKQFICESIKDTANVNGIKLTLDGDFSPRLLEALKSIAKSINGKDARLIKKISLVDFDVDDYDVDSNYDGYTMSHYGVMIDLKKELDGVNAGPDFIKRIFPDVCKGVENSNVAFGKNDDERYVIIYGYHTDMICVSFNSYFDSVEDDKDMIKAAKKDRTNKTYKDSAEWAQGKTIDSVIFAVRNKTALNAL